MIKEPERAKKMAVTGLRESKRFSIEKNVQKLEELYSRMLGKRK